MKLLPIALALTVAAYSASASAGFINGNFETGTTAGWTTGGGYRGNVDNTQLNAADFVPGGALYNSSVNHSSIVTQGIAPFTDGNLNQVYSGTYSFRAEDTVDGGYASVITQSVSNYTDSNIFFAWAAVLEGAHTTNNAATFKLTLRDNTAGVNLITRQYNAANGGSGVDSRFTLSSSGYYYTSWQVEQLALGVDVIGHDFTLTLLAADCEPTAHTGFVYLDGFGAVTPPPVDPGTPNDLPAPGALALLGIGGTALGIARRKR